MHLNHVFLHTLGIVASQNAEQFVIRQEEEPREGVTF